MLQPRLKKIKYSLQEGADGIKKMVVHFTYNKKSYTADLYTFLYYSKAINTPAMVVEDNDKPYPHLRYNPRTREIYCDKEELIGLRLVADKGSKGNYNLEVQWESHFARYDAFRFFKPFNQQGHFDSAAVTGVLLWKREMHLLDILLPEPTPQKLFNVLNNCELEQLSPDVIDRIQSPDFKIDSVLNLPLYPLKKQGYPERFILNLLQIIVWDKPTLIASNLCKQEYWVKVLLHLCLLTRDEKKPGRHELASFLVHCGSYMKNFENQVIETMLEAKLLEGKSTYFRSEKRWHPEVFKRLLHCASYRHAAIAEKLRVIIWIQPYISQAFFTKVLKNLSVSPADLQQWVIRNNEESYSSHFVEALVDHHHFVLSRWLLNSLLEPQEHLTLAIPFAQALVAKGFVFDWQAFDFFIETIGADKTKLFRLHDERGARLLTAAGFSEAQEALFFKEIRIRWAEIHVDPEIKHEVIQRNRMFGKAASVEGSKCGLSVGSLNF